MDHQEIGRKEADIQLSKHSHLMHIPYPADVYEFFQAGSGNRRLMMKTCGCRLNSPDSHYWGIMDKIREQVSRMQTQGITAEQAATDIADGLSKPKPPRYVYTGTHLRYALFMGFLQVPKSNPTDICIASMCRGWTDAMRHRNSKQQSVLL